MKKNVAFTLISFTLVKWDDWLSVQLTLELLVQLFLELEVNWLVQNVIELEFELPYTRHYNPLLIWNRSQL